MSRHNLSVWHLMQTVSISSWLRIVFPKKWSCFQLLCDCPETYDCHFFRQDLPRRFILLFYHAGAPRFPNSPPVQVHGYLSKETRIQCDPLGNPTPKIEWTRTPSAPLPRGRSEVRQDGLYIKNTESEDDGIYTCIAANEFGRVIQGAYLKVNSFSKW